MGQLHGKRLKTTAIEGPINYVRRLSPCTTKAARASSFLNRTLLLNVLSKNLTCTTRERPSGICSMNNCGEPISRISCNMCTYNLERRAKGNRKSVQLYENQETI